MFETFAGIGSQTKALNNIGADVKIIATSEWYTYAMIGYNAIHHNGKYKLLKKNEALDFLKKYTISNDSKKPSLNIARWNEEKLSKLVSSIKQSNNLGSIMDIKGTIVPEHDLLTYSFPCQDLSIAGKGKGIEKGTGTRSSLMWEVERILHEMKQDNKVLPKFLLMENVPTIKSDKYRKGLNEFKDRLEYLGYTNHFEIILYANKLGIPQKRKRFFMISTIIQDQSKIDTLESSLTSIQNIDLPFKFKLRNIISKPVKYANREEQYINAIEDRGFIKNKIYTNLGVYPTFAQANIVTGYMSDTIATVTFSGENSRQRVAILDDGKIRVIQLGGYENLRLMGFDAGDYKKILKSGISDNKISGLAGNSIVVQQLEEIFKCILEVL